MSVCDSQASYVRASSKYNGVYFNKMTRQWFFSVGDYTATADDEWWAAVGFDRYVIENDLKDYPLNFHVKHGAEHLLSVRKI